MPGSEPAEDPVTDQESQKLLLRYLWIVFDWSQQHVSSAMRFQGGECYQLPVTRFLAPLR